jgi:hypothetical protein
MERGCLCCRCEEITGDRVRISFGRNSPEICPGVVPNFDPPAYYDPPTRERAFAYCQRPILSFSSRSSSVGQY